MNQTVKGPHSVDPPPIADTDLWAAKEQFLPFLIYFSMKNLRRTWFSFWCRWENNVYILKFSKEKLVHSLLLV